MRRINNTFLVQLIASMKTNAASSLQTETASQSQNVFTEFNETLNPALTPCQGQVGGGEINSLSAPSHPPHSPPKKNHHTFLNAFVNYWPPNQINRNNYINFCKLLKVICCPNYLDTIKNWKWFPSQVRLNTFFCNSSLCVGQTVWSPAPYPGKLVVMWLITRTH